MKVSLIFKTTAQIQQSNSLMKNRGDNAGNQEQVTLSIYWDKSILRRKENDQVPESRI